MFRWFWDSLVLGPFRWAWKRITGAPFEGGAGISQSELEEDEDEKFDPKNTTL